MSNNVQVNLDGEHEAKICCTTHAIKMQNDLDKGLVDTFLQYCYWETLEVNKRSVGPKLKEIINGHINHIHSRARVLL